MDLIHTQIAYIVLFTYAAVYSGGGTEYCQDEYYEASCPNGQVVIIDSASYGVMKLGRCVTINLGYLGCYGNVLNVVGEWCSGKQSCRKLIAPGYFNGLHNCPKEVTGYLNVEYSCHKALQITSTLCSESISVQDDSALIPLKDLELNGCGRPNTPLVLEANTGQYFNITVLDFSSSGDEPHSHGGCSTRYGRVTDLSNHREMPICSGNGEERQTLLSNGNIIQITVDQPMLSANILLQYNVIGCEDLMPTNGATMHRKGDSLLIKCAANDNAWELRCIQNQWIGNYEQCSNTGNSETQSETKAREKRINISHELIIIVAGTVVLFASGVIVCVGILHICNRRTNKHRHQSNYGYTYNPRSHSVLMHTIPRAEIPDFTATTQHTMSRTEMPDVVDQTLTRTLPPPVPAPVMNESIYENPGHTRRGSGSCIYSSVHMDNLDNYGNPQVESNYSDSVKYYVLDQHEEPNYGNTH